MKTNMWFGFGLCLYVLTALATVGQAAEEIKVGYFKWPPLIDIGEGMEKPEGPVVDYYEHEIAPKMGVSVKWIGPYPVPRVINLLENHELDMVSCLTQNPERAKIMTYADAPFYIMKPVVCLNRDAGTDKLNTWEDLTAVAKNIGIHYGTAFHKQLSSSAPQLNLRFLREESNTIEYALRLVADGQLDAFIHSDRVMTDKALANLGIHSIKCLDAPVPDRPFYVVFSSNRSDLLEKYNSLYDSMTFDLSE